MATNKIVYGNRILIDLTEDTVSADKLLENTTAHDRSGNIITGTIETKSSDDLIVDGATINVPKGYYSTQASKSVSIITQATPSISVSSSGLITATSTQSAGYVVAGTKSSTKQLSTKGSTTYTPTTSDLTISSGLYLTGNQIIKGDSNLKSENIKSGVSIFGVSGTYEGSSITPTDTINITSNGIYDVTNYASANVNVAGSGGESTLKKLLDNTKSCRYIFSNYTGTSVTDLISYSDTENVTNMDYMFRYCSATTIPQLNTSKVTNMSYMFSNCSALTTIPQLNTSIATDIDYMFGYCNKLTTIPQLNTSSATDMNGMFYQCYNLTTIPQLDTSKAAIIRNMFYSCRSLTTIDITYYKISSTSNSSSWCRDCYSLKTIIIRSFSTSYALNSNAFSGCYHLLGTVNSTYNPNGDKDCYIYVPRSMVDTLKSATNWSTYADQIRALEDYTVDGTTTGELDESKVNA